MKKILLSLTFLLLLVPNIYSAAITDIENGGKTNSKTTVENHYTDKNVVAEVDLSNKKVYEFTSKDTNGYNLLLVLKLKTSFTGEKYYDETGKEVAEEKAVFKLIGSEDGFKVVSLNDDEIIKTTKKTKLYSDSVKTDSHTTFTGVTISNDFIQVGEPDDLNSIGSGSATYNYRQDDYYTRTNYYLNLTYGQDTITYKILEGDNETYKDKDIVIKASAPFEKFDSVKVNDEVIDKENYNSESGSTIITLKNDYLKTLNPKEYKVEILFSDGSAFTTFKILTPEVITPKNEKNNNLIIYIVGAVAIIGIILSVIALIKKKNK